MSKFDDVADSCLRKAENYARVKDKDDKIRLSHVIFAILNDQLDNIVLLVLKEMNIDSELLTESVEEVRLKGITHQDAKLKSIPYDHELQTILNFANENTVPFEGKTNTGISDIFVAALQIDNELSEVFADYHINFEKFLEISEEIEADNFDDFEYEEMFSVRSTTKSSGTKNDTLEKYCKNLTKLASENKIDVCYGRTDELNQLYRILCRVKKRNAILLGREGVGKTNLIEGLAVNIVRGTAPKPLLNKTIYSLDLNSLVSGTKYRGQFEERVELVLNELVGNNSAVLFIDELHNIIGAGSAEGTGDLSNILKPHLARKDFQVIGATTTSEYKKFIEPNKAFARRFSDITLEEPSIETTISILNNLKVSFETLHNVSYTKGAISACVELSHKYMPYRTLPDKAIDLLDDVASKKRLMQDGVSNIVKLQEEYKALESKKIEIIETKAYHLAQDIKKESNKILSKIKNERSQEKRVSNEKIEINEVDIKNLIQEITKIPINDVGIDITALKNHLLKKIIGQDEAINSITKTILLNKLELDEYEKPIGTFLFIGFSGVGKTEITKETAKFLNGKADSLIRIDCSEYSQAHDVSKLIGAPAGFIGYEDGGILTEQVRRNPFSVILFDEIEKAHDKLFDILLQVLGEGRLTDNKGETVNFKNTIIIMTSNIGTKNSISSGSKIGFGESGVTYDKSIVEKEIRKHFKPEFLNRIDNIVHFNVLSTEAIKTLLNLEIEKLKRQVEKHSVELVVSDEVIEFLMEENYSIEHGFRPFKRKISNEIKLIIAEILLDNRPKIITLSVKNKKIEADF